MVIEKNNVTDEKSHEGVRHIKVTFIGIKMHRIWRGIRRPFLWDYFQCGRMFTKIMRGRTGLMVRASDSGSGDPGSILGRVGVFVSLSKRHLLPKKYW